jgi:hypothetical protein
MECCQQHSPHLGVILSPLPLSWTESKEKSLGDRCKNNLCSTCRSCMAHFYMDNPIYFFLTCCPCDWEYSSFSNWTVAYLSFSCTFHHHDKWCKYWNLCREDVHNPCNACINSTARQNKTYKWNRSYRKDPQKTNL